MSYVNWALPHLAPFSGAFVRVRELVVYSNQPNSLQKLRRQPRSPRASLNDCWLPRNLARCASTPLQDSSTCVGVSSASMQALQRGLSVTPNLNRCLLSGLWPVMSPMIIRRFCLFRRNRRLVEWTILPVWRSGNSMRLPSDGSRVRFPQWDKHF